MRACRPPRGTARGPTCAAVRSSHLAAACVLLLLLVAAAAAVPAYAGDSGDTSPVCKDMSCYSMYQVAATSMALAYLGGSIGGLSAYWGTESKSDFCTYTGVTCRQNGVTVTASGVELTGWLPVVYDGNSNNCMLAAVDLSDNSGIGGTLPASWSSYPLLRRFVMSGTSVNGSLSPEWSALSQLQTVDLRNTRVDGELPDSWSSLTLLETLLLDRTRVSGGLPPQWGGMKALTTLSLASTEVEGDLPATWSSMTALKSLSLYSTAVTGLLPAEWAGMVNLQTLLLDRTRVSGGLPPQWGSMEALRALAVDGTQVRGTLPETWSSMRQLETLLLNGTLVYGTVPESWGALKSLRTLDLSGTSVTGCLPRALVEANGLTEAGVGLTSESSSNCRITEAPGSGAGDSSSGTPKWVVPVVVAAVGFVVVVGVVVFVVCCCRWSRRRRAGELADSEWTASGSPTGCDSAILSRASASKVSDNGEGRMHSRSSQGFGSSSNLSGYTATCSSGTAERKQEERHAVSTTEGDMNGDGRGSRDPRFGDCSSSLYRRSLDGVERGGLRPPAAVSTAHAEPLCAHETVAAVPVANPLQRPAASAQAAGRARHGDGGRTASPLACDAGRASVPRCTTEMRRLSDRAALAADQPVSPSPAAGPHESRGNAAPSNSSTAEQSCMTRERLQSLFDLQNPETADSFFGVFVEDSTYTELASDESTPYGGDMS